MAVFLVAWVSPLHYNSSPLRPPWSRLTSLSVEISQVVAGCASRAVWVRCVRLRGIWLHFPWKVLRSLVGAFARAYLVGFAAFASGVSGFTFSGKCSGPSQARSLGLSLVRFGRLGASHAAPLGGAWVHRGGPARASLRLAAFGSKFSRVTPSWEYADLSLSGARVLLVRCGRRGVAGRHSHLGVR